MNLIEGFYKCWQNGNLELKAETWDGWASLSKMNATNLNLSITEMINTKCQIRDFVSNLDKAVKEFQPYFSAIGKTDECREILAKFIHD